MFSRVIWYIPLQASENVITGKKTYKLKDNVSLAQAWVTSPNAYYNNPPDTSKLFCTVVYIERFSIEC